MDEVVVLMSTYNGEKYLREQIDSLIIQKGVKVRIFVRDDGSTDNTINILNEYQLKCDLSWYSGKNLKPALSFLDLINNAPKSKYYAFCDQDDVWMEDKLIYSLTKLKQSCDLNKPALYCGNYQLVDENLNKLPDNNHVSTTKFSEALVSSCATGCTIVFNDKLIDVLQRYTPQYIVMHDDWTHKVCLAVGGEVVYDNKKLLYYRQHSNNVDGGIHTFTSRIKGILHRMHSNDCIRSRQISEILKGYDNEITKDHYYMATSVANYKFSIKNRFKLIFSNKIRTPYFRLNIGFKIAILLGYY